MTPPIIAEMLEPDEDLLWLGRPRAGFVLRPMAGLELAFFVAWTAFAVIWESAVVRGYAGGLQGPAIGMALFGLPFIAIGIYHLVFKHLVDHIRRKRRFYAVTSKRLIVASEWPRRSTEAQVISEVASWHEMIHRADGYLSFLSARKVRLPIYFEVMQPLDMQAAVSALAGVCARLEHAEARVAPSAEATALVTTWTCPSNSTSNRMGAIFVTLIAIPFGYLTLVFVGAVIFTHSQWTTLLFMFPFAVAGVFVVRAAFLMIKGLIVPHERTLSVDAEAIYWGNVLHGGDWSELRNGAARARKPKPWSQGFVLLSEVTELHYACTDNNRNYLYLRNGKRVHLPDDILVPSERMEELARAIKVLGEHIALLPGGRSGQWY